MVQIEYVKDICYDFDERELCGSQKQILFAFAEVFKHHSFLSFVYFALQYRF